MVIFGVVDVATTIVANVGVVDGIVIVAGDGSSDVDGVVAAYVDVAIVATKGALVVAAGNGGGDGQASGVVANDAQFTIAYYVVVDIAGVYDIALAHAPDSSSHAPRTIPLRTVPLPLIGLYTPRGTRFSPLDPLCK